MSLQSFGSMRNTAADFPGKNYQVLIKRYMLNFLRPNVTNNLWIPLVVKMKCQTILTLFINN